MEEFKIPQQYYEVLDETCLNVLERYINNRTPMGHFLTAVVGNDLSEAVCRADSNNSKHLRSWVELLYNYAPSDCHGSKKKVEKWLARTEQE